MLALRCPHCGLGVQVEERWAGQQIKCGGCGGLLNAAQDRSHNSSSLNRAVPTEDKTEVDRVLNGSLLASDQTIAGATPPKKIVSGSHGHVLIPFFMGCFLVFGVGLLGFGGIGLWWLFKDQPSNALSSGEVDTKNAKQKKDDGARWTVLFRSDKPELWNTAHDEPDFALPVEKAPADVHFVRLRRMDTSELFILPITRGQLTRSAFPAEPAGHAWNGTAKEEWGALHLGIAQAPRYKFPIPHHRIVVTFEGWDGWLGSGFGHQAFNDRSGQYYCWRGQQLPRTVFEIAVTDQQLGEEEKKHLLAE